MGKHQWIGSTPFVAHLQSCSLMQNTLHVQVHWTEMVLDYFAYIWTQLGSGTAYTYVIMYL